VKLQIKGKRRDLWAFLRLPLERSFRIRRAAASRLPADPLRALTEALHPQSLDLVIQEVRRETEEVRTYTLAPAADAPRRLPVFRAGQYLSVGFDVGGVRVNRPYSISCSPAEAAEKGSLELTIQRRTGGFAAPHIYENWKPGTRVRSSGPLGQFYYEPLRDTQELVFLAGGCGITPLRSLWRDLRQNHPGVSCTVLYGAGRQDELVFRAELEELAAELPERFRVHFVLAEPPPGWRGSTGLLTSECIRRLVDDPGGKSYFICGPPEMYRFLAAEIEAFGLPPGRIRSEACGEINISGHPDFPAGAGGRVFTLRVKRGEDRRREVPARADETVLSALERAGLAPPAQCRSGTCGWCRSLLVNGRVFVPPETDGRRLADRRFGYIHPCSSYPITDMEIRVPDNPLPAAAEDTEP
jgi:ferredoxin-NADP reductase